MDHNALMELLQETGIPWTYHHWEKPPLPPYGVFLDTSNDPFFADNKTYADARAVRLEVYTLERDPALDAKVAAVLTTAELPFESDYLYIETENLYESTFEIEV